jgi:hypothetical protein
MSFSVCQAVTMIAACRHRQGSREESADKALSAADYRQIGGNAQGK